MKNLIIILIALILTANIFAEQVMQIELQVNSENTDERNQAFAKALDQVLIKNSDNPNISTLPIIKNALLNPNIYIQLFTYVNHAAENNQQALFLQIQFNQTSIMQLLQQVTQSAEQPKKNLVLRITNINNLEQCNKAIEYLITFFSQITQADLYKISASEIELNINTKNNLQALLIEFNMQNKLMHNISTNSIPNIDLDYNWVITNNEQLPATNAKSLP